MKKHFYTDGVHTIKLEEGAQIPAGFYPGRTFQCKPWNKGLTKQDPRVRANTEKCHQTRRIKNNYRSWNKGLTKITNQSLKVVAQKVSVARKGKSSWNKGIPATQDRKQKQSQAMKQRARERTQEQIDEMNRKSRITKAKNNSFHTSKIEDTFYTTFVEKYGFENVIRQYQDERYPFSCDFYIKSEDLFIEINYSWTHGAHPFDANSMTDQIKALTLLLKAKGSRYYQNAYNAWVKRDVKKLTTLRQNNLNFMLIYPKDVIITNK